MLSILDTYHTTFLLLNSHNPKREENYQYISRTSTSHKLVQRKLHDSILLEFELIDFWLVARKQPVEYASLQNDFNVAFEIWQMYFVTSG